MIQKGIVQYNQCEGENDDISGVEDAKLWLEFKSQFKLQTFSDWLKWTFLVMCQSDSICRKKS